MESHRPSRRSTPRVPTACSSCRSLRSKCDGGRPQVLLRAHPFGGYEIGFSSSVPGDDISTFEVDHDQGLEQLAPAAFVVEDPFSQTAWAFPPLDDVDFFDSPTQDSPSSPSGSVSGPGVIDALSAVLGNVRFGGEIGERYHLGPTSNLHHPRNQSH